MKKMKITKGNKKYGQKKADKYVKYIEILMAKNGGKLTPEEIVADAKNKQSVLHDFFDWDDTVAAKKWRLEQARCLMQNLVEIRVVDNKETEVRSYWSIDKGKETQAYVKLDVALKTPSYREELIDRIINHLSNTQTLLRLLQKQK